MKNIGLHEQLSITLDLVCFSQHAIADNNIQLDGYVTILDNNFAN